MKKMKRLVSALLAICLIAVMIPVTVSAAESGTCGDNLTWTFSDDGVLTISGTGPMADYDGWDNCGPWFDYYMDIKVVVIEDGVTYIGAHAFDYYANLTTVTIPDSVTAIGDFAFFECYSLTDVTIGNSVTHIGDYAFKYCKSMTGVTIPDSVTSIGVGAFASCNALTSITIPHSVTSIGANAFSGCAALTGIYVNSNNACYCSDSHGVLFNKNKTDLLQAPSKYQGHYSVPKTVTSIGDRAFSGCAALTGVTIPSSVTSIGEYAFSGCDALTAVTIGENVASIGDHAFDGCDALTAVTIPDSVTCIGESAFYYCESLTSAVIGNGVTSIGKNAFSRCGVLADLTIGNSVTSIGGSAFTYCEALSTVTIPDSVTTIGYYAFGHCYSLTDVTIGNSVTSIGGSAFYSCNKLASVTIGESVTSIGSYAFDYCRKLTSVTIPASVTSIGECAFGDCDKLTEIIFCGNAPFMDFGVFYYVTATAYYPANNATWTSQVMKDYYGTITWVPYEVEEPQPDAPAIKASNVASTGKIKVTWDAVEGAKEYQVYRATSKTGTYKLMKTTTKTSYSNTSVDAGKTYYYYVVAVNADGKTSEKSNIASRTCDLAQPVISTSNVASSGKIKVSWEAIDGAVEYEVYRATSKTGTYKLMKTTTSTSYTNTGAEAGKTYYYKVKAIASKSAANSAESEVKSRTCDLPRPDVSIALSSGKPKVSWKAVEGAVEYEVYRATSKDGTYKLMKTTTKTSYANTSATAGKTYYYKVIAVASKSSANSAYSSVVSIKSK